MSILLLIFNFADIFLTLLLSWDYKNDPCKVSSEQKNWEKWRCIWHVFFFRPRRPSRQLPLLKMNWFYQFCLNIAFWFHLSNNFCTSLTSIKRAKWKKKKNLNEFFSILSLLHPLILDVWVNDSSLSLLTTWHVIHCRTRESCELPGTIPVLSVLTATFHSRDPDMGLLEALQLQ